jgi:hypothetical protein
VEKIGGEVGVRWTGSEGSLFGICANSSKCAN